MSQSLPLVLASASPRRQELLARLGLTLVPAPVDVDETPLPGEPPLAVPLRLARAKAEAAAARFPELPVLAGDTVVVLDGRILGKPQDREDARRMLLALRGRTHVVASALALVHAGKTASVVDVSRVTFTAFSPALLEWYLAGTEWQDKAGAYALQGQAAVFVDRVEGNVQAVVGLPLARIPQLLAQVGLELRPSGSKLLLSPRSESRRPAPSG